MEMEHTVILNSNDLRYGNKLQDNGHRIVSVDGSDIISAKRKNEEFNAYHKPILLTTEVLEACKMDFDNNCVYDMGNRHKCWSVGGVDIMLFGSGFYMVFLSDDPYYSRTVTKVEYLHNLQNICYVINDKELEIDEEKLKQCLKK